MSDDDIEYDPTADDADRRIEFEWSDAKAASNLNKHGVAFEEAATAFDDDYAYLQEDELHSESESREWLIGYSDQNRLLMITFIQRAHDLIRIISARLVTRRERKIYEEVRVSRVVYRTTPHVAKLDDYELPSEVPLDPKKMKPNRFAGKVKLSHGGARSNAGRKPAPDELVSKRVYLYPRHIKALEKIDKNVSAAIRKLVDESQK